MRITDESFGKYVIEVTPHSYDVGTIKYNKKEEREFFSSDTFHSTLERAVLKIALLRLNESDVQEMSLLEYKLEFERIKEEILNAVKLIDYV